MNLYKVTIRYAGKHVKYVRSGNPEFAVQEAIKRTAKDNIAPGLLMKSHIKVKYLCKWGDVINKQ